MHKTLQKEPLKTFHFFEGDACVRRRGRACPMAQWHSGQSKPDLWNVLIVARFLCDIWELLDFVSAMLWWR